MHTAQIVLYALVQGITELFPVSSVGHAVLLPYLAGWSNISNSPQFLPFIVMLHLGTAVALLLYFWQDWVRLIASIFDSSMHKQRRLLLLIIVATIPAAIIGKVFEHKFRELFPSALSAALFLIVNGIILLIADRLKHRQGSVPLHRLSFGKGFLVGLVQVLALIPGFSRSGITMTAGLGVGLEYDEAARFAFLLATPIIAGAGILEVPKVLASHDTTMIHLGLLGGLLSGLVAFLSTAFLMHYFRTHEVRALRPFAYYCIVVGGVVSILAALGLHA